MKYKAIILDLDGTTVPSLKEGMPSPKVKEAIKKAKKVVKVCIATGRPIYLAKKVLDDLEIEDPCVLDGGAEIRDMKTGEVLYERLLSAEKQREIAEIAFPFKYEILVNSHNSEGTITKLEQITKETQKMLLLNVPKDRIISLLEEFTAVENVSIHPTTSWNGDAVMDLHVTHEEATKKHGIEELLKILDLSKEEVIGVGDSHNDMPLFKSVGFKAVMGDAPDEIKKIADYIAPTIENDGVADVIEKFILNPI